MIIVIAQRIPYPPNKGEKLRTFHHIKRLTELGHDVTVLSIAHTAQDSANASALSTALNIDVTLFPVANFITRNLWALVNNQAMSVAAFYSKPLQRHLNMLLAKQPSCTVYLSASSLAPYILENHQQPSNQLVRVMDFMDVDSDKWEQYANLSRWPMSWVYQREAKLIRAIEKRVADSFDHSFLIADAEIALFKEKVAANNHVTRLGNGMDFSSFYPGTTQDLNTAPCFLFTGVMDYKPNVDAVVWFIDHCWPEIKQALPEATFVIAGMNPSPTIQALNHLDGVEVTGFVDNILPYYHRAWTFVAPFRLARGVQNKVLQAAACRIPIVTTPMGAEGILFANEQSMSIETDAARFTQACIDSVTQRPNATEKAALAYDAITQSYSWESQLAPLVEAIEQ